MVELNQVPQTKKRMGRPPVGPEPKTREENLERMRTYSKQHMADARSFRRLMAGLPRPMTIEEILDQLTRPIQV